MIRLWSKLFPSEMTRHQRLFFAVVLGLHFALAVYLSFAIPLRDGPDEGGHIAYVKQLVTERSLPHVVGKNEMVDKRTGAIGAHPPLAYVTATPVYALTMFMGDDAAGHALRLYATVWSGITLVILWLALCQIFPGKNNLNLAALAFAALLPEYVLLSSVWNSDGLLILLSTLFLWRLTVFTNKQTNLNDWVWLGALWGCLLITKATALMYVVPVFLVLAWQVLRKARPVGNFLSTMSAFVVPGLAIGGWWFVRGYLRTGTLHPVPDLGQGDILLKSPFDLIDNPNSPALIGRFVAGALRSLWGQVDWNFSLDQLAQFRNTFEFWPALWGTPLPKQPALFDFTLALYRLAAVVSFVAIIGLIARAVKKENHGPFNTFFLFFALLYGALGYFTLYKHIGFYEASRYLLPGILASSVLWCYSLGHFIPQRMQKWLAPAIVLFFTVWNCASAVNLVSFLVPYYHKAK